MYWEGLVARADIQRGGELAKQAARMLAAEVDAKVTSMAEQMAKRTVARMLAAGTVGEVYRSV